MEYCAADFLQFFVKKRQNLTLGWTAGYSKDLSRLATREATRTFTFR